MAYVYNEQQFLQNKWLIQWLILGNSTMEEILRQSYQTFVPPKRAVPIAALV